MNLLRFTRFSTIQSTFGPRSLIYQTSSQAFLDQKVDPSIRVYTGFDPTSESLHLGNFLPIVNLMRLGTLGISPIFLIGGATGSIGDPSGKS